MRWKSEVQNAELTPARTWSKRDEGNFGGRSLLTPDQNTLSHHGVPGMHWGVTTKEYVKKGYDTLKRRQAILKQKRQAEAKAQYEEGYRRGQRVASNTYFIKERVAAIMKKKKRQEEGSLSDRAVNKAVDYALKKTKLDKTAKQYGLDQYIPQAKDFLKNKKDEKLDDLYEYLQTENGQKKLTQFANFMGRGVSAFVSAGYSVARVARKGGQIARQVVKTGVKSAAKIAGSSVKSGYKWLRIGNPTGAQKIKQKVRTGEKFISKLGNASANTLQKGAQRAHSGARNAQKQLDQLLAKRRRRS